MSSEFAWEINDHLPHRVSSSDMNDCLEQQQQGNGAGEVEVELKKNPMCLL